MSHTVINKLLTATILLQALAIDGFAQVGNAPGSQTQVPGPRLTPATAPSGYIQGGQSPLINYVRERDGMGRITDTVQFAAAAYMDVKQTTQYFDGLGRPLQTVQKEMTPGGSPADVVAPVVYDAFGREVYKYLPYVAGSGNTSDGGLKQDPFTDQNASAAAVAESAPISSAPSPPMITMPRWAGRAVQSAVKISGAARVRVFCQENQVPNAP